MKHVIIGSKNERVDKEGGTLLNRLRKRVIQKYGEGKLVSEIEKELSVKTTFVYDMLKLYKETGSVEAKPATVGRKPTITEEILSQIEVPIFLLRQHLRGNAQGLFLNFSFHEYSF